MLVLWVYLLRQVSVHMPGANPPSTRRDGGRKLNDTFTQSYGCGCDVAIKAPSNGCDGNCTGLDISYDENQYAEVPGDCANCIASKQLQTPPESSDSMMMMMMNSPRIRLVEHLCPEPIPSLASEQEMLNCFFCVSTCTHVHMSE